MAQSHLFALVSTTPDVEKCSWTSHDGTARSIRISRCDGTGGIAQAVTHASTFSQLVPDNLHNEEETFTAFQSTLIDAARLNWTDTIGALPAGHGWILINTMRTWIEAFGNAQDTSTLLSDLRTYKKPRSMTVNVFVARLRTLNSYVAWMPGNRQPLDNQALRDAFFQAMPTGWRTRFLAQNMTIDNTPLTTLTQHMSTYERIANEREAENIARQRTSAARRSGSNQGGGQSKKRRFPGAQSPYARGSSAGRGGQQRRPQQQQYQRQQQPYYPPRRQQNPGQHQQQRPAAAAFGRLPDSAPCPVHFGGRPHRWGECRKNICNPNSDVVRPQPQGYAAAQQQQPQAPAAARRQSPEEGQQQSREVLAAEQQKPPAQPALQPARQGEGMTFDLSCAPECADPTHTHCHHLNFCGLQAFHELTPDHEMLLLEELRHLLPPLPERPSLSTTTSPNRQPLSATSPSSFPIRNHMPSNAPPIPNAITYTGLTTSLTSNSNRSCVDSVKSILAKLTKGPKNGKRKRNTEPFRSLAVLKESLRDDEVVLPSESDEHLDQPSSGIVNDEINAFDKATLAPISIVIPRYIQGITALQPLRALFDSGSDASYIHYRCLPDEAIPQPLSHDIAVHGIAKTAVKETVFLEDIMLPEFSSNRRIRARLRSYVLYGDMPYDLILGRDFLSPLNIDVLTGKGIITWDDLQVPFRSRTELIDPFQLDEVTLQALAAEPDINSHCEPRRILDAKYERVDPADVAKQQKHLSQRQQQDLAVLLRRFPLLFDGVLKKFPGRKIHLDLEPDAQPVHQRAFPVPAVHHETFRKELDRLCEIGVLERCGASEWAAPTFIIPKKDGRVRWISDFRQLNKVIRRKIYPLPKISEILNRRSGYKYFTKLDVSMQYYTFELDDESKELCVIVTPFGKYRYNRLPMGVKQSPDVAQEIMEDLFRDLDNVENYIDDIGCFDSSWEEHLQTLAKVLKRLEDNKFIVKPEKCEWGVQETDWLGHWLTPIGLKPWRKKIDALLELDPPQNRKQVRHFIGAVNYYRDMFPQRAHLLAPLTDLTGKGKFVWTDKHQQAFLQMKAVLAREVLLSYPDHNLPFHVYTDASDLQLGAVIMQNKRPVAFYSRKLNSAQRNYTTIEKELLSIVETLKEFRTMLYGCRELHVHTDHRNLTYQNLTSQRVIRWRLFLEEFHPHFHYVKGEHNVVADALSRLPRSSRTVAEQAKSPAEQRHLTLGCDSSNESKQAESHDSAFSILLDEDALLECFINFPSMAPYETSPLDLPQLAAAQLNDAALVQDRQLQPQRYLMMPFASNANVVCYRDDLQQPWRIVIPSADLDRLIQWYHMVLNHCGITRTCDTIALHFHHPRLRERAHAIITTCDACQRYKLPGRGQGLLPAREANSVPWQEIAVDLIGPWTIEVQGQQLVFRALTVIDTCTNFPELIRINSKSAAHVALQLENAWLTRYPSPVRCIFDQGPEFIGRDFQDCLRRHSIHRHPTTIKNPQANALCERLHQTVTNALHPLLHAHPPQTPMEANLIIDSALQTAAFSARAAIHSRLKISPGALAFHRDMFLDIPLIADMEILRQQRQALIDQQLM